MKRLHLFEAVGLVDDRLVEEAADAKRTAQPWSRWLAAAACVALAVSLGTAAAGTLLRGCGSKSTGAADMAAPAAAPAPEPASAPAAVSAEAATEAAVSEEKMEDFQGIQNGAKPQAAAPDIASAVEGAPEEPAGPLPGPAGEPANPDVILEAEEVSPEIKENEGVLWGVEPQTPAAGPGTASVTQTAPEESEEPLPEPADEPANHNGTPGEAEMGMIQNAPELYAAAAAEIIITPCETERDGETGIRWARYRVENRSGAERTGVLHFTVDTGKEGLEGSTLEIRIDGETVPFDAHEAIACPAEDGPVPEPEGRHFLIEFSAVLPAQGMVEVRIRY